MKALIIYDDIACAANTAAILHQVAHDPDVAIKWEIRPWRLKMLKSQPTAKQVLGDATDAHLIIFAVRSTPKLPLWVMNWLEQWAGIRYTPDAAVAIIGDATRNATPAQATVELSQFARRHDLSFICNHRAGTDDPPAFPYPRVPGGEPPLFPPTAPFPKHESNDTRDLNI